MHMAEVYVHEHYIFTRSKPIYMQSPQVLEDLEACQIKTREFNRFSMWVKVQLRISPPPPPPPKQAMPELQKILFAEMHIGITEAVTSH